MYQFSSVHFSLSVVSDYLQPHESQHARPPCPSPTPGVHSHSRPSSPWWHPAISSSVVPFSSCPQSLPASVFSNKSALRMRWPKYWSFSFSKESDMTEQLNWTELNFQRNPRADLLHNGLGRSPCSPRDSQESSPTPQFKSINCVVVWAFFGIAFLWDWNENWRFPVLWPLMSLFIYFIFGNSFNLSSNICTGNMMNVLKC